MHKVFPEKLSSSFSGCPQASSWLHLGATQGPSTPELLELSWSGRALIAVSAGRPAKNSRASCLGGTASSAVPPVLCYAPSDILLCCGPTDSAARTESTECSQLVLSMIMSRTQYFSTSMIMSKISARGALQVDGCAGGRAPQALFSGKTGPRAPRKIREHPV